MKLTKAAIDRAEYQNLPLVALEKQHHACDLSDDEYQAKRQELLGPFTSTQTKDSKPKYRRFVLWDDEIKGLGLRVTPSGVKTFVLSYRHNGTKRLMKLGRYGVLTLDQARERARGKLVLSIDGVDPLKARQDSRLEAALAEEVEA